MRGAALLLVVAGCSAVYNAQYDDRQAELERSRTVFLPGSDAVSGLAAGEDRIYWNDDEQTAQQDVLHSIDTRSGTRIDYAFDGTMPIGALSLSDGLVADCGFDQASADDATTGSGNPMTLGATSPCAAAGDSLYFVGADGSDLVQWQPYVGAGTPATLVHLPAVQITNTVTGVGVADAHHVLIGESGNLWLVDVNPAGSAALLNTTTTQVGGDGAVALDAKGVVFPRQQDDAPMYTPFADPTATRLVSDMIADGGYDLNAEHGDIQDIVIGDDSEYAIWNRKLVYNATGGIFALDLDTGYVIDILLDGRPNEYGDLTPQYYFVSVTNDGSLFVQEVADQAADTKTVYRVDLTARFLP